MTGTGLEVDRPPLFVGATAAYPYDERLREHFAVTTRTGELLELAQRRGDYLLAPRACCPVGGEDRRTVGQKVDLRSAVVPRTSPIDQRPLLQEAGRLLDAGESFILEAGTGTGKTVMACDLIARVGRKALVVVTKEDLFNQWARELRRLLPGVRVGFIRQRKYDVAGKDVVVGMIHSLCKPEKYPSSMRTEFGLVVWDEVHRVGADTFSATAAMFVSRLRLGLSATPSRWDGKEVLFKAHIGPVRVRAPGVLMKPTVGIYASPWRCPRVRRGGRAVRIRHTSGKCGHIIRSVSQHEGRNALLLRKIRGAHAKGRRTVVFSDRIAQLERLRELAVRAGVPYADTALYVSGLKKAELDAATAKPLILATYGMMGEGTDVPWLDCCILATPRSSVKQAVGRILREYPDKPTPVVLDVVDHDSPVLANYARAREWYYGEVGAKVVRY